MRLLSTTGAMLLAAAALQPAAAMAKSPSGGGLGNSAGKAVEKTVEKTVVKSVEKTLDKPSGNSPSGNQGDPHHNYSHDDANYHSSAPTPYVVQSPIIENPVFSGGPIKIVNPVKNGVTLNYTLNGFAYAIEPGQSQEFTEDRAWVIEFSRGGNAGLGRYGLHSGLYTFGGANNGWELFNEPLPVAPPNGGPPANPPPPATLLTNPSPGQ